MARGWTAADDLLRAALEGARSASAEPEGGSPGFQHHIPPRRMRPGLPISPGQFLSPRGEPGQAKSPEVGGNHSPGRRHMHEQARANAATTVQASVRGRAVRRGPPQQSAVQPAAARRDPRTTQPYPM